MRTFILGGATAMLAGVVTGLGFWSDLPTQTMAKSPRLETPRTELAAYAEAPNSRAEALRPAAPLQPTYVVYAPAPVARDVEPLSPPPVETPIDAISLVSLASDETHDLAPEHTFTVEPAWAFQ